MPFATVPVYAADLTSQEQVINTDHIQRLFPNVNVPVDPDAVDTESCRIQFKTESEIVVLLPYATMKDHLQALTGVISEIGGLT
jgi:hypothetical protein